MNREIQSDLRILIALAFAQFAVDQNTATLNAQEAGRGGSGFDSQLHVVTTGATVDAGLQIAMEDSSDGVTWSPVIAANVVADVSLADQNAAGYAASKVYSFGYVGCKAYSRLALTIPGATDVGVQYILGRAAIYGVKQNAEQA